MKRVIKKFIQESTYLICKIRGHNPVGDVRDARDPNHCKRCEHCTKCWTWRGTKHWLTGNQTEDDRWIK